jgi:hypothetical protein
LFLNDKIIKKTSIKIVFPDSQTNSVTIQNFILKETAYNAALAEFMYNKAIHLVSIDNLQRTIQNATL